MNILFILKQFPRYGGVEKMTITLSNSLVKIGYNVCILSLFKGNKCEYMSRLDSKVVCLNMPNEKLFSRENRRHFLLVLQENEIDVIINQNMDYEVNKLMLKLKGNVQGNGKYFPAFITVVHNDPFVDFKCLDTMIKGRGVKNVLKRMLKPIYQVYIHNVVRRSYIMASLVSDKMVVLSKSYVSSCAELSRCEYEKIIAIPNGFNVDDKVDGLFLNRKKLLYVGRLVETQKKISELINIWKYLCEEFLDWDLLIVGDGPDVGIYKSLVKSENIKNVYFEGSTNSPEYYFNQSTVVCLTSESEGFPMVLIEGMKYGCIPICYDSFSAVDDIIDDGVNGYVIPFNKQNEYICKLRYFMSLDDTSLCYMRNNAIKKSELYDINKVVFEWEKLFNELI